MDVDVERKNIDHHHSFFIVGTSRRHVVLLNAANIISQVAPVYSLARTLTPIRFYISTSLSFTEHVYPSHNHFEFWNALQKYYQRI